jgi:hypothetical protein
MDINDNTYISTHFSAPAGIGSVAEAEVLEAYEMSVARRIFEKLWEKYPGYDWKVAVNAIGGIASIKLPRLHHSALGYNIPMDMLATDPNLLLVVRGGGELLERFRLSRTGVNKAEYTDKIKNRPAVFRLRDSIDGGLAIENKGKWVHGQNSLIAA